MTKIKNDLTHNDEDFMPEFELVNDFIFTLITLFSQILLFCPRISSVSYNNSIEYTFVNFLWDFNSNIC